MGRASTATGTSPLAFSPRGRALCRRPRARRRFRSGPKCIHIKPARYSPPLRRRERLTRASGRRQPAGRPTRRLTPPARQLPLRHRTSLRPLLSSLFPHLLPSSSIDCSLTIENEDDGDEDNLASASSWVAGEACVRVQGSGLNEIARCGTVSRPCHPIDGRTSGRRNFGGVSRPAPSAAVFGERKRSGMSVFSRTGFAILPLLLRIVHVLVLVLAPMRLDAINHDNRSAIRIIPPTPGSAS